MRSPRAGDCPAGGDAPAAAWVARRGAVRLAGAAAGQLEQEILELREAGWLVAEIARGLGISRWRVARMIERSGGVDREGALAARPGLQLCRARERSEEILDHYRQGRDPRVLARELGLDRIAIGRVVSELSTDADRVVRARELARARRPRFSDEDLLDGLVRVADRLGCAPTGAEYSRLAAGMGLASGRTVSQRLDGWCSALAAAGFRVAPRSKSSRWDQGACWRALESVADQLGDPPRYRRYLELARGRHDLPPGQVLRDRLGLWSHVVGELTRRELSGHNGEAPVRRLAEIRPRTSLPLRQASGGAATDERRPERAILRRRVRSFSEEQLIAGVRAVGERLGHTPSGGEYRRLAARLGLASLATVYARFGNWSGALEAAGYQAPAPARVYTRQWETQACWNALDGVTDQLGDRPTYRRYQQLAAGREDLPSGALLRQRLGAWSQIAAELRDRSSTDEAPRELPEGMYAAA